MTMVGILDTNAFEIRTQGGAGGGSGTDCNDGVDGIACTKIRGLYAIASIMAHDCQPNTKHTFTNNDYKFTLIATRDIMKGESITVTYAQLLNGTVRRREHLKTIKYFDCDCKRCEDPTELGMYIGSSNCTKCVDSKVSNFDYIVIP